MKKIIYTLSAFMMACIISFSGVGGTYINAHATSVGIPRPNVWNDDESVWDNILRHLKLYASVSGVFTNPLSIAYNFQDFIDFMGDNGYSHDIVHGIFCDCDEIHTSFSGQEHGGGGFVRDGITTDEDGNVTYSDEVCDLFHGYIVHFIDSHSGYYIYKTIKASDIGADLFSDKIAYENFVKTVDNLGLVFNGGYSSVAFYHVPTSNLYTTTTPENFTFISNDSDNVFSIYDSSKDKPVRIEALLDNWQTDFLYLIEDVNGNSLRFSEKSYSLSDISITSTRVSYNYLYYMRYANNSVLMATGLYSSDGRNVKIWYDLEMFKNYDLGKQMYYVTDSFNNYDSTIDNSTTITSQEFAYYYDNSSTIYQTIQNNITNYGGELDEKTVQDIVDSAVQDIKDSISNSGNQGGNDSGDSDNGGNGVGDLVGGIGKLLDTILSLIGKVMGVVADFTQSILDLFSGFTDFTDGFSSFLSGAFSFIPQEIWNVIQVGLSLMILLAVIKFLRK